MARTRAFFSDLVAGAAFDRAVAVHRPERRPGSARVSSESLAPSPGYSRGATASPSDTKCRKLRRLSCPAGPAAERSRPLRPLRMTPLRL